MSPVGIGLEGLEQMSAEAEVVGVVKVVDKDIADAMKATVAAEVGVDAVVELGVAADADGKAILTVILGVLLKNRNLRRKSMFSMAHSSNSLSLSSLLESSIVVLLVKGV